MIAHHAQARLDGRLGGRRTVQRVVAARCAERIVVGQGCNEIVLTAALAAGPPRDGPAGDARTT